MAWLMRLLLLVPAAIHLVPVGGVLGVDVLARLYGVAIADPTLELLMRHRAMLFGIVGGLLLAAAWQPAWRTPAIAAGFASLVPFLALAALIDGVAAPIARIVATDWVALASLAAAAFLHWRQTRTAPSRP